MDDAQGCHAGNWENQSKPAARTCISPTNQISVPARAVPKESSVTAARPSGVIQASRREEVQDAGPAPEQISRLTPGDWSMILQALQAYQHHAGFRAVSAKLMSERVRD